MKRKRDEMNGYRERRGFKNGSIKRIYVKDFMTYQEVEVYPGPNLNVLIGPNGTGKSTLMCAICLGLGGDPSAIGRASKLVSFIRNEQNKAIIEITVHNENGSDVVVKHIINRDGPSEWFIDDKKQKKETMTTQFKSWNINMNNLCQFQSQEKVQDFAKMTSQQLLKNTQVCTGDHSLEKDLEQLVMNQNNLKELQRQLHTNRSSLDRLVQETNRLEREVENYKTYRAVEAKIDLLSKKLEMMRYQALKGKADEAKQELTANRAALYQAESKMKPLKDLIASARQRLDAIQREITLQDATLVEKARALTLERQKMVDIKEKILEERSEYETSVKENEKLNQEIADVDVLVQRDRRVLESSEQNNKDYDPDINELQEKIHIREGERQGLRSQNSAITTKMGDIMRKINDCEKEKQEISNIMTRKLEKLRQLNPQAYQAYTVLDEMRKKGDFVAPVYEPLAITLSVTDQSHAKYVEKTISGNDMFAFSFEDKGDMNRFLSEARGKRKLKIAAYHCPPGLEVKKDPNLVNPVSMDQLQRYGFEHYLSDLVVLNNSQLRYLCKMYKLHRVPIGGEGVTHHLSKLRQHYGQHITLLYAGNYAYNIRRSKFSGEFITRSYEVGEAKILTSGVDQKRLDGIESQMALLQTQLTAERVKTQEVESKIRELERKIEEFRIKQKDLLKQKNSLAVLRAQMQRNVKKIEDIRKSMNNLEELKARMDRKCKDLYSQIASKQDTVISQIEAMKSAFRNQAVRIAVKEYEKKKWEELDGQREREESELGDLRNEFARVERAYNTAKRAAADKLQALREKNIFEKSGTLSADLLQKFREESDDIDVLENSLANEEARLSCMPSSRGSGAVVQEYEEKKRQMELLQRGEERTNEELSKLEREIRDTRERYVTKMEELISEISKNFGNLLAAMGCAGEVVLDKGAHEHDYLNYGIRIRVKYRDSEQLRDLTFQSQSGGERSVATALYMMAIQELTTVPFRCVDEINQGMDAVNERKVFDLLVQTSCDENSAQYFLLTPKLLPNLNYSRHMKIHDVHNGRRNLSFKQWNLNSLVNRSR